MEVEYWADARGRRPVFAYIEELARRGEVAALASLEHRVDLLEQHGVALGMPHTRIIDRRLRLHELRFADHRIAYVVHEGSAVLLHAWRKRSRKLDEREANVARRRLGDLREGTGK